MLYFRPERCGGVLFDSSKMSFQLLQEEPVDFSGIRLTPRSSTRKDILSAPVAVYYELLNACNLSCRHCFACSSKRGGQRLATSQSMSLVEHLSEIGIINLRVTGGEPTCHPDWVDVLARAKELGLVVSLQTNGIYEDVEDTVAKLKYLELSQLSVSLDGDEETHDWLRGGGSYAKLMAAVRAICSAGIKLRFNTILHDKNIDQLGSLFQTISQYGEAANFFFLRPVGRALQAKELLLTKVEHLKVCNEIDELAQKYPELKVFHSAAPAVKRGQTSHMPFGMTVLCVAHDGTIWPLQYLRYQSMKLSAGKFPMDRVDDVWAKSGVLAKYRSWQDKLKVRCQECSQYGQPCSGIDPEVEIAFQLGCLSENLYCTNEHPAPKLDFESLGD